MAALLLDYLTRERVLFPIYARDLLRKGHGTRKGFWHHLQEMEEKFVDLMEPRLFAQGIEAGQFLPPDPRLLTFLFRGMIRAIGYYQMVEGTPNTVQEALPVLLHLLSSGLAPQPGTPAEVARMISGRYGRLLLLGLATLSLLSTPGGSSAAEPPPTLDLQEALRLAWKANPTLKISRLQSLIAGEEVVRARSGFLPTVKSQVSQTIYDDPLKFKITGMAIPSSPAASPSPRPTATSGVAKPPLTRPSQAWGTPSRYQPRSWGSRPAGLIPPRPGTISF